MTEWTQGTVVETRHWTDNLYTLRIDAEVAPFIAGQFTSLGLDLNGERVARPYSFLNAPEQRPLEFFFYTAIEGVLSHALCQLQPGDSVWVKTQANGFFVLDEVPNSRDLWLLGTGTGVAPFLSMLHTDTPWQRFENIVLVNAVRHLADICYEDRVLALQARYPGRLRYQTFVSRETVPGSLAGRIPAALADGRLSAAVGLDLDPTHSQFMLCGNPDMVNDTIELLKTQGFARNRRRTPGHITTESYW